MFVTIIHVAALAERGGQRCRRCGEILIDAAGAMTYGGLAESMRSYAPGAFVGVTMDGLGRRIGSILMDHDARESDERACLDATPR